MRKICDDITNNQKYFVHRRNLVISSLREKTGGGHRPWQKNAQIVCIAILAGILATFYAAPAFALTSKQIMKECRKKYGKSVLSGYQNKKGKIICTTKISDKNAMKECRKKFGKSVISWRRDKNGKISCIKGGSGGSGAAGCSQQALDTLPHAKKVDLGRRCFKHLGPITLRRQHGKWVCVYSN